MGPPPHPTQRPELNPSVESHPLPPGEGGKTMGLNTLSGIARRDSAGGADIGR